MLDKQDLQAIRELMSDALKPINARLDALEQGQKALEQGQKALEQGQKDLKAEIMDYIDKNNLAIADLITEALEGTENHVKDIEKVTKDNLYDLTILKQKQSKQG